MIKILKKILIPLILASILLAPISPSFQNFDTKQIRLQLEKNVVQAQTPTEAEKAYREALLVVVNINNRILAITYPPSGTAIDYPALEKARQEVKEAEAKAEEARKKVIAESNGDATIANAIRDGVEQSRKREYEEKTANDYSLECVSWTGFSLGGCIASLFWWIWWLVAKLGHLGGRFLDYFIYYSINDNAYRNAFVDSGWAAVRDVANIFFIIALLYVAIQVILDLHGHEAKKRVGMIIIIALLINFSLFTTKVVIDGSNILAKLFYNNITSVNENGSLAVAAEGEKSISVGLIEKFNPQKIIDKTTYEGEGGKIQFIFVTIVLILLIMYAAYIFFSVAILFVSRVVALWLSMVFAPLAFASFTVPFDMQGFGHKEWSKQLFENALLAPIFIFMLYLIVLFMDIGQNLVYTDSDETIQQIMAVVIPFAVVFILLKKAKEIAVKMAGEIGVGITKLGAVLGGLALGTTALAGAGILRGTVGNLMKGASTGDSAAIRFSRGTSRDGWDRFKGAVGQTLLLGQTARIQEWLQPRLNQNQHHIHDAETARHDLDQVAKDVSHGHKTTWNELNGQERYEGRRKMARDQWIKDNGGAQGWGTKKWEALGAPQRALVDAGIGVDAAGHAMAGSALLAGTTAGDTLIATARRKTGLIENAIQSTVTGGFDVRDWSKVVAKEHDTIMNKFASSFTSILGNSMRSSLKSAFNTEYGTGQRAFFKDLGHTISEAMKGAKINVDLSHVGHEEKEGHKGGGGGHGH